MRGTKSSNGRSDYEKGDATRQVRKKAGVRAWLMVDSGGHPQVVEASKHVIMLRTGLPARDLRILDPLLSYPSTILGRERAIVINLEHIKAIITPQEIFLLNSRDPSVIPFVDLLCSRILRQPNLQCRREIEVDNDGSQWEIMSELEISRSRNEESNKEGKQEDHETRDASKVLPFEFVALEACLEAACSCLDIEARTLEQEAHPALDKLTSKISTLNLERVRQIKSRLVAITGRVQKVRDELEHLLDDDGDMAEMYLSDKLIRQQLESSSSINDSVDDDRVPVETPVKANEDSTSYEGDLHNTYNPREKFLAKTISRESRGTRTSTRSASKHLDVVELEMLLEAYFVQIDGTLNKLSTLREYVDDTEDYINIMLDDKQNHLLQMGVMLTTATLVVSAFVVVAGIFGMNIKIDMFNDIETGMHKFVWTVIGGAGGSIFLYVIAIVWCKRKRLLE